METEIVEPTELVLADDLRPLELEYFTLGPNGLVVKGDPPFEAWAGIGDMVASMTRGLAFIIGDWVNCGERLYGEKAAQIIDARKFSEKTVSNFRWLAASIPPENRRTDVLTFSHHQVVAQLPPVTQKEWLDKAAKGRGGLPLTVAQLRAELAARGLKPTVTNFIVQAYCSDEPEQSSLADELRGRGLRVYTQLLTAREKPKSHTGRKRRGASARKAK